MIHPDIQYQLCGMAQDERVREGLYEQQVVRAALAKSRDDGRTTQRVSRLTRAVALPPVAEDIPSPRIRGPDTTPAS